MEYYEPKLLSKNEIEKRLSSSSCEGISAILVDALNSTEDWEWLLKIYLSFINHTDFWIAKTSIDMIVSLFRIYKHDLDLEKAYIIKQLNKVKTSRKDFLYIVEEAEEEINHYLSL